MGQWLSYIACGGGVRARAGLAIEWQSSGGKSAREVVVEPQAEVNATGWMHSAIELRLPFVRRRLWAGDGTGSGRSRCTTQVLAVVAWADYAIRGLGERGGVGESV